MPRTETITRTLYKFDELSDEAKEEAISKNRDINVDDEYWFEHIYEDAKTIGSLIGITIENIYFRGFCSQGDGACFTGSYSYEKGSVRKLKEYAPKDTALHSIAERLFDIQKRYFYGVSAKVIHRGHYMHENCTEITVDVEENPNRMDVTDPDAVCICLKDFMRWIYRTLEKEYDHQIEDEQVAETLRSNDLEFMEDGSPS